MNDATHFIGVNKNGWQSRVYPIKFFKCINPLMGFEIIAIFKIKYK